VEFESEGRLVEILFQNKEYRLTLLKIIIYQIICIFLIYSFFNIKFQELNKVIIRENTVIVGKIMIKYPEMEEEIVKILLKTPSESEYNTGKITLDKYSYNEDIDKYSNLVLKNFIYKFNFEIIIIILLLFLIIILLLSLDYRKIYLNLKKYSNSIENITRGVFETNLPDSKEGELNILGHNINLLSYRYKETLLSLNDEKMFLKNIVSDISHQLKTPLSSLIIINEIMLNNKKINEEDKENF
jgi:signal transduction histidine kinase